MRSKLRTAVAAAVLCLSLAAPAAAAEPVDPQFKAEIDGLLKNLDAATDGVVHWDGADRIDLHRDGDASVADFVNARLSIGPHKGNKAEDRLRLVLDRIEVRRSPAPDGGTAFDVIFPHTATLRTAEGGESVLTLDKAGGRAVVDAKSSRIRETALDIAKASLADQKTGDRIALGPLSLSSKLVAEPGGGWQAPITASVDRIDFYFTEGPVSGTIAHIGYTGQSAGPSLAGWYRLRDQIDALHAKPPPEQRSAIGELLPQLLAQFSLAKGEVTVGATKVHNASGENFVAFDKASLGGALSGLSGKTASWRLKLAGDGLLVSPDMLDPARVPHHLVLEFGMEDLATAPLRTIIAAAIKAREDAGGAGGQLATMQLLGAAAALNPVLRVYNLAFDTRDVGITGTAETKGSPVGPNGFKAKGEVSVRGFAALGGLVGPHSGLAAYLPLLEQLGVPETGPGGGPVLAFHLASAPPQWLSINGNDVSAWFTPDAHPAGGPRPLRPADPPMKGAEVDAVQHALAAAGIKAPQNGRYDAATAAAVARFQKINRLNVDGVVDTATRQKLGLQPRPQPKKQGG
ncbi:MAG TPA: peptidoglycan-binding domain-containing protein [Stellaceae bacterium]|nr:peptidoglycan-binding domain-containing protein [Stellaceae bacterium]